MAKIIDLTMPIENHFRWPVERKLVGDFERGDAFQVTWIGMGVHGFTHIDSPRHMVPLGETSSEVALDRVVGDAVVVDLSGIKPNTGISVESLEKNSPEVIAGDIVLLRAAWDLVESYKTPEFWTRAPYMTKEACEWLMARKVKAVGFDFPQDYPIRGLLKGKKASMSEFITHDVLLRQGIILIEYLCNLSMISGNRTTLVALPIKLPDADGAPARVIALNS